MDIKKKLKEFNKRFDFIDNSSYEEELSKFKTRVLNIFTHIDGNISREGIELFCQILGIPMEYKINNITNALYLENNEKKFYRLLQIIFSFLPLKKFGSTTDNYTRERLISKISEAVDLSNINLSITVKNGEVIFFPKGETILDEVLVNEVLSFLNVESQKHFIESLASYLNYSKINAVKSAESIRRSIEEFLRFKLQNKKGLKENISELQKRLKTDKRDSNLRQIIFQIFTYLDKYFNENSKHEDGKIDESENEFLIYQTGLLMRYIHKIIS